MQQRHRTGLSDTAFGGLADNPGQAFQVRDISGATVSVADLLQYFGHHLGTGLTGDASAAGLVSDGFHIGSAEIDDRNIRRSDHEAVPPHEGLDGLILPEMLGHSDLLHRFQPPAGQIPVVDNFRSPRTEQNIHIFTIRCVKFSRFLSRALFFKTISQNMSRAFHYFIAYNCHASIRFFFFEQGRTSVSGEAYCRTPQPETRGERSSNEKKTSDAWQFSV
jgi:hypothetical protein